ncbi:hypothetical protein [Streptomyces sp. MAR4 CNX-425]|uniref:hypothetical protein n=1 Tax=Streptomyces sp. MAR4 CNX-425 TaxID=3406343 RepID=UPI003B504FEF
MRLTRVLAGLLAAGMLTACGGGDGGDDGKGGGILGGPSGGGGGAPEAQLKVPALYDTSRGWESDLRGTQHPLPHSGAVGVYTGEPRQFTVLDVTSGDTLWTSAKLRSAGEDMRYESLSATAGGKDYLVLWGTGTTEGDVVSKGSEITTIDIFDAEGSGEGVKPARHVELEGEGFVSDGGGGLMVKQQDGDVYVTVDLATGATEEYDLYEVEPPASECNLCGVLSEIQGVTAGGPLLWNEGLGSDTALWVPDGWTGAEIDADARPYPSLILEDVLVARWRAKGATHVTWGALDSATGEIRAEVQCEPDGGLGGFDAEDEPALSANGRYLVRGNVVFDLEQGGGHCFEETDTDKPVEFDGVTDTGLAFGVAPDTRVVVDIATGKVEASKHLEVPFADYAGHGLFWDEENSSMVVYPHAS